MTPLVKGGNRFLHHAEIVQVTGKSYRLRHQAKGSGSSNAAKAPIGSEEAVNGSNAAKVLIGSEQEANSSNAAKAPIGSDGDTDSSNAAKAPMRSKTARGGQQSGGSRPITTGEPAAAPEQENKNAD